MDNKEIYMKDLKRAYDVFQWLQINSDNIKKIYDIISTLDYSNFTTKEEFEQLVSEFEELVRETPNKVRTLFTGGQLVLNLEKDDVILNSDWEFGDNIIQFILGKTLWQSVYYVDYLVLEGNSCTINIRNCIIHSQRSFSGATGLQESIHTGNFWFLGLQGYGYDGNTESLPITIDYDNAWIAINAPQGQSIIDFSDLEVTSCMCTSLLDGTVIDL